LPAEASAQAGKKKSGGRKIKKCEENFCAGRRALASGGGQLKVSVGVFCKIGSDFN